MASYTCDHTKVQTPLQKQGKIIKNGRMGLIDIYHPINCSGVPVSFVSQIKPATLAILLVLEPMKTTKSHGESSSFS